MHFIERLTRWEGILFGFIIGVAATVVGSMAYNEINGMLRVSHQTAGPSRSATTSRSTSCRSSTPTTWTTP
jgi:hypothetical protein